MELKLNDQQIKKFFIVFPIIVLGLYLVSLIGTKNTNVEAKDLMLQEKVELNQQAYNTAQEQAKKSMSTYCESWKNLALSKIELAEKMQIATSSNKDSINAVNCNIEIQSAF